MQRVFLEDVGRNFKRGEVKDYPMPTWRDIARSIRRSLDAFSKPVDEAIRSVVEPVSRKERK